MPRKKPPKLTFKLTHERGSYPVMVHLHLQPDGSVTWTQSQQTEEGGH